MGCKVKSCSPSNQSQSQPSSAYAMDKSLRSVDADGHMRVEMSRISKANVCPYRGSEIPKSEELGLDPHKTYRLYRHPDELAKAAGTFDGKPLLIKHVPVTAELPQQNLWVGTLGACTFEAPYLVTRPLTVISAEAQALIEAEEQRELSAGYRYRADMTPGTTPEGEPYDGVMRDIQGNHTAIVREGRAGADVHVADEFPSELRSMKHRTQIARLQKAIPALANLSTADLMALDAELGETPAKTAVSLSEDEKKAACDAALDAKRMAHGEDAELTDEEREEAIRKAADKKAKKAAKDKKAADALKGHRPANDAKSDAERREEEEESDEQEAAADAAEEEEDEREAAEDAEEDGDEARDRRKARDERRRARDRRAGARDARKAARDSKAAHDAEIDHRKDFNSNRQGGANKSGKDARPRAHDSMTMDQVNAVVQKAVSRAQAATAAQVREEVTAKQRALAIACDEVTPLVGKVQIHAFDSAGEVYAFAAEKIGIEDYEDLGESALRVLIKNELRHRGQPAKKSTKHALDSKSGGFDADALFQRVN